MDPKFLAPYDPQKTEPAIYKKWEDSGYFNPDTCIEKGVAAKDAEPFTIMMPPPNATGVLHMGHAMALTLEDIMIRFRRMQGRRTLYVPGTDHAAIATQSKVEKEISKKEGKSRHDLGREELLRRIDTFVEESRDTIRSQIRSMGASADWSREAFTLDAKRNLAVRTMFKKMYDDGLIYRGNRIVNWDPKGQTTISDDEIVYEERKAKLYTFKYSTDFPISISTTRPETKVGDVAVAVHPDDERYQKYVGQTFAVTFCGVPLSIKIIADKEVDPAFGTGALGVTPAHSQIDWLIAERHDLPRPQVINEFAKMTVGGPEILGKKTTEAREAIVAWLRDQNLLEKEEEVSQNVSTAERTGGIIEPLPKLQWFINVNKKIPERDNKSLKELMQAAVKSDERDGPIEIIPNYFSKTYFHWIGNLQDWCISRQIWYGHQVPVWYKGEEIFCGTETPTSDGWTQDPDTLDTWFSSGSWTFSALGWPEQTDDIKTYHPTNVLETGYDILFFWIARMILMSEYALGTVPFEKVYLHGLVRDAKGQKMSKSLGNGFDPIDVAQKFGADAGRMALIAGTAAGTDSKISEDKIKGYKHFANKLWNITRFILSNQEGAPETKPEKLTAKDTENLAALSALSTEITSDLENFRFHLASEKIYHYIWHELADKIIEESKPRLVAEADPADRASCQYTLRELLRTSLALLHPFMPFVTEEIWTSLRTETDREFLMISSWPSSH
jgi:valyl-tRNA synthetase